VANVQPFRAAGRGLGVETVRLLRERALIACG